MAVDSFDAGSPFDFRTQMLIYVPQLAPPAGSTVNEWRAGLTAVHGELLEASNGSALMLSTSKSEMNASYDALSGKIRRMGHTALKQGDDTNKALAKAFNDDVHSVLFGVDSFMTGVDFQGQTLRLLSINKLTFPVPSDVVLAARVANHDRKHGKWSGFNDVVVPKMALKLLQGVGRGVRTVEDKCLVVIGDSRVYGKNRKPYGARVMAAMPNAPVTTSLDEATAFLKETA